MHITEDFVAQDDLTFGAIPERMHQMAAGIVKQALGMQLESQDLVNQIGAYERCLMAHVPERFDYETRGDPHPRRRDDSVAERGRRLVALPLPRVDVGHADGLTGMFPGSLTEGALGELFDDAGRFLSDD